VGETRQAGQPTRMTLFSAASAQSSNSKEPVGMSGVSSGEPAPVQNLVVGYFEKGSG
jgi:hypothetical protein